MIVSKRTWFYYWFLGLGFASAQDSMIALQDSLRGDSTTFTGTVQQIVSESRRVVKRKLEHPSRFLNQQYVIVLDPGHGGTKYIDKGFSAVHEGVEYYEKDIAWDYANLVEQKLIAEGYTGIKKTKSSANDSSLSIYTRPGRVVKIGSDAGKKVLLISFHWNNFDDPSVHGTEIYIKERHNNKSRKLAEYIRGTLSQILEMHGVGQNVTGIVERDYKMLRELDTGVLIELGYASNPGDLKKMLFRKDEIANAIVQGVNAFAEFLQEQDVQKGEPDTDPQQVRDEYRLSEVPNIPFGWSWKKKDITVWIDELMRRYDGMYEKATTEKEIFLTFDCGYENGYTPKILDVLKANNVPAAFFITGGYLKQAEDVVQRMLAEGHIVGNHSVNHLSMPQLRVREMRREILGLEQEFYDRFEKRMIYFRPPSGEWSRRALAVTEYLGYKTVFWSFAYDDWDTSVIRGKDFAYNKIMPQVRPGLILLLHAVSKDNMEALDTIIKDLKKDGYRFGSLDEIQTETKNP